MAALLALLRVSNERGEVEVLSPHTQAFLKHAAGVGVENGGVMRGRWPPAICTRM